MKVAVFVDKSHMRFAAGSNDLIVQIRFAHPRVNGGIEVGLNLDSDDATLAQQVRQAVVSHLNTQFGTSLTGSDIRFLQ